jgi:hypothetical protein
VLEAPQLAQPDQWHTIWNDKTGGVMNVPQRFFAMGFHDPVHSGNAYVVALVAQDPFVHRI